MPQQDLEQAELRVLHWNVHGWRDRAGMPNARAVIELILNNRPHAVSLVEVDESWGHPSILSDVGRECGYSWMFGPSFEYGDGDNSGAFGNALLAKVPVTAVHQWRVFTPAAGYDGSEPSEPRSAIVARLLLDGISCWLGSTHFPRAESAARRIAAGKIQQLAARFDEPWLICGDFNAPPASCFGEHAGLRVVPEPVQPTYPASDPCEAIDYCLSAAANTVSATVLRAQGSDHLPLLVVAGIGSSTA